MFKARILDIFQATDIIPGATLLHAEYDFCMACAYIVIDLLTAAFCIWSALHADCENKLFAPWKPCFEDSTDSAQADTGLGALEHLAQMQNEVTWLILAAQRQATLAKHK